MIVWSSTGFAAAVVVSILFPEAWARIVEWGRKALIVVQRVKVSVERLKE
jgi:hypothetical protein